MVAPNKSGITSIILKSIILHLCGENSSLLFHFPISLISCSVQLPPHPKSPTSLLTQHSTDLITEQTSQLWALTIFFKTFFFRRHSLVSMQNLPLLTTVSPHLQYTAPLARQNATPMQFSIFLHNHMKLQKNRIITLDGYLRG